MALSGCARCRVRHETALREIVNLENDQILIVDLGGAENAAFLASTFLGAVIPEIEGGGVVI